MRSTVISAVVAAALFAAPLAGAHTTARNSRVTIGFTDNEIGVPLPVLDDPDTFQGTVTSQKEKCVSGRTVTVYRQTEGGPVAVGSDETDAAGAWVVEAEDPGDGTYFARAARKEVRVDDEHQHVCRAAKSPEIGVEDA